MAKSYGTLTTMNVTPRTMHYNSLHGYGFKLTQSDIRIRYGSRVHYTTVNVSK